MKSILTPLLLALAFPCVVRAELKLPAIIGDHMVLQQKQANPIWGWDTPGTKISVRLGDQTKTAEAGADGKWTVKLDPLPANAKPAVITIEGTSKREIQDVLVGEVWMCSGQSNMGFKLKSSWNSALESLSSNHPNLRLMSVPLVGTQEKLNDFKGEWKASTPQTSEAFSAVGFMFGRYLHEVLNVPVGLIDNSWGGSAAEAWVRRETLESDPRFKSIIDQWTKTEATYDYEKVKADFAKQLEKWKVDSEAARKAGKPVANEPRAPQNSLTSQFRPGNIFAGTVHPTLGYGIKGVIWYQGETNSSRAYEYAELFPFMIQEWRKEWQQGDFPFYWVQLADFRNEVTEPGDSNWAELRESQTKTQKLANTGQAVIIDLGEANDIHPRNKRDVAARLAAVALAKDYGIAVPYHSPEYKSIEIKGDKAIVTLDTFGSSIQTVEVNEVKGLAICGADQKWHWAQGKIFGGNKLEVTSTAVPQPVAVRYAWADNPVANLYSKEGLPVTPFRSDDFEMITKPKPVTPVAAPAPAATPVAPKKAA